MLLVHDAAPRRLSSRKRRVFKWVALFLPFCLLAAVEGLLRLLGWGGYPPFVRAVGKLPSGETLCIVEPAAAKPYFFANPSRPGYAEQYSFVMPKPANTVRVFLVGESAAKGYPQPRNLAMSAFLQELLNEAWTGRTAEVINFGTTAVASFPLVYLVRDALAYDPDLFIFYTGNNEFFGAYGTGSINATGSLPPAAHRILRALRGLALAQALAEWRYGRVQESRTLMEEMIGRSVIPLDSPLRAAAARNLRVNLGAMLDQVNAAGVPAIVCTTAANEAGLAPMGEEDESGLGDAQRLEIQRLLDEGGALLAGNPTAAVELFRAAVARAPRHARARFQLGRAFAAAGDRARARAAFLAARDMDTLPWRPVSEIEAAIRAVAEEKGAVLCDLAEILRREGSDGATGWEWMDDHVHLSLRGQERAARAMAEAMTALPDAIRAPADALARPGADARGLAERLGANFYDEYRVNHTLRVLFGVAFMARSNPEALARYAQACRAAEARMSPSMLAVAREWQTMKPHAGGIRPITAMAARVLLRENQPAEALRLYEIAGRQVPEYTSWHIEYAYFALACQERLAGGLSETGRAAAARAIAEGRFLLAHGYSQSGLTERYLGRLHQLRGEWAEAIPLLLAARPRLCVEDRLACDQALITSYIRTGQSDAALALVDAGIRSGGRLAGVYQNLRLEIERAVR